MVVIEFLQKFPEPGRICQNHVNQKQRREGQKENGKINQQDADAD
jgi:hypothetical protein